MGVSKCLRGCGSLGLSRGVVCWAKEMVLRCQSRNALSGVYRFIDYTEAF